MRFGVYVWPASGLTSVVPLMQEGSIGQALLAQFYGTDWKQGFFYMKVVQNDDCQDFDPGNRSSETSPEDVDPSGITCPRRLDRCVCLYYLYIYLYLSISLYLYRFIYLYINIYISMYIHLYLYNNYFYNFSFCPPGEFIYVYKGLKVVLNPEP